MGLSDIGMFQVTRNVVYSAGVLRALSVVFILNVLRIRWAGHVACMEEGRGVHKVLVGKREGKRPLGRPRRRW